jgi:Tat protein translocase TatB subunit
MGRLPRRFLPARGENCRSVRAEEGSGPYTRDVFNLGPGEMIVILVAGLVVLGPEKLPDMIRKAGRLYGELRRMANGFQSEFRDVFEDPMTDFKETAATARRMFDEPIALVKDTAASARSMFDDQVETPEPEPDPFAGAVTVGGSDSESEPVTTGWEGAATSFDQGSVPFVPLVDGAKAEIRTWGAPEPSEQIGDAPPAPPAPVIHLKVTE